MVCGVDQCDTATQFHCSRGTTCISSSQECDGHAQCSDTSDEANCSKWSLSYYCSVVLITVIGCNRILLL